MHFVKSVTKVEDFLNDKLQICLIGRSNVGKSSLINAVANQKIAYVSSSPGRTQCANYFDCGNFYLVDLPGYGYANLSKSKQMQLVYVVEDYLANATQLKAIFQVVDANVITKLDCEMSNYFNKLNVFHYVIINKIDKQSNNFTNKLTKIATLLNVNPNQIILVSALKRTNIKELIGLFKKVCH